MAEQTLTEHRDLIESYLLGRVSRDVVLRVLGPDELDLVEIQRDALQSDVEWGRRDA